MPRAQQGLSRLGSFSKQLLPRIICCRGHRSLSGIVNNKRNTGALFEPKEEIRAIQHRIGSTTGAYQGGEQEIFSRGSDASHASIFALQRKSPAPRPGVDAFLDAIGVLPFYCTYV